MEYKEFITETVNQFNKAKFDSIKQSLLGEYIRFNFISKEDVSQTIFEEKLCDYFEKLQLKTSRVFDKQLQSYTDGLNAIVEDRIAKAPKPKKDSKEPVAVPRARQYYDKARTILKSRDLTVRNIIDYSRIMLCLYVEIINNNFKPIENFDFSADCLDQNLIINAMKDEKRKALTLKYRFDTKELYSLDTCVFIMAIIMLHTIANERG